MMFCEKCGAMLVPKKEDNKVKMVCNSCNEVVNKRDKIVLTEKVSDSKKSMVEVVEKKVDVLPKVDEECPKCKHGKAFFWLVQTRAGDEAETRFFKCVKCDHTWREY
tara:strand:- start:145 stop:465 length:321 start_codon:yes stop_codon:yes gene_type:complete